MSIAGFPIGFPKVECSVLKLPRRDLIFSPLLQDIVLQIFSYFEREQSAFLQLRLVSRSWLRCARAMSVEWTHLKVSDLA